MLTILARHFGEEYIIISGQKINSKPDASFSTSEIDVPSVPAYLFFSRLKNIQNRQKYEEKKRINIRYTRSPVKPSENKIMTCQLINAGLKLWLYKGKEGTKAITVY